MLEVLFWACMALLVYCYFGYPVLLYVCSYFRKPLHVQTDYYPSISLLIPAYNEEDYISAKIENCLALNYPRDSLEILLINDGSSDRTAEIMRRECAERDGITCLFLQDRQGKLNALNVLVEKAKGEVLVFSDANVMLDTNVLRNLARHYIDKSVGGVCGNLVMESAEQDSGNGEIIYKRYDQKLKELESQWGCAAGGEGAVYSVRKELCKFFPVNKIKINDDLLISMQVVKRGYKLLFEPLAVGREQVLASDVDGFRRRVRIAAGNFHSLRWLRHLINPFNGIISAWVFFSHKILRWAAPFLLIATYILNLALLDKGFLYLFLFLFQNVFYGIAGAAALLKKKTKKLGLLMVAPHYFVIMNLALLVGFFKYLNGTQSVCWEKHR